MEKKPDLNESNLLIDFTCSPVPVRRHVLHSPLIPVPAVGSHNCLSASPTNNPFDIVAKQSVLTPDPFEFVLKNAQKQDKDSSSFKPDFLNISNINDSEIKYENFNCDVQTKTDVNVQSGYEQGNECDVSVNVKLELQYSKPADESVTVAEADSQSLTFGDISTEEGLKAIIAQRINNVVAKAISNSRPSSPTNTKENNASKMTYMNRRSLSFITETKKKENSEKLNKSFSFSQCSGFNLDDKTTESPDSSIWFLNNSNLPNETSLDDDSVFLTNDDELVFKEANKLARTFSKIADSFCHDTGVDHDEDLLTCKPRWLYADSSEDEEEKLKNDPALNVRVSLTPVMQSRKSEPAGKTKRGLSAFLKKTRRSLDLIHNKSSQEDLHKKSSEPEGENKPVSSGPSIPPPIASSVPVVGVVNPTLPEAIKLKKRSAVEGKRGPMRAVMPVQSMTRETALIKGKPKQLSQEASPPRKQNSMLSLETPKASSSDLGMRPVASSTPNRPELLMPSPLAMDTSKTKKRRSLGSSLVDKQMHNSRISEAEGARQRSNSVNSKIPALNSSASKSLRSSVKSASDLGHSNPSAQVNSQQSKLKSSNLNAKQPSDLKAKISPKIGFRNPLNAGLHLAGKLTGRKTTSHNKENKIPS